MSRNPSGNASPPKPYEFVPFAPQVKRRPLAGHERLDLTGHHSGRLVFRLEALTPVFVGTGSYALGAEVGFPEEKVLRPFYRVSGTPTIPGSSLKGVARSIAEAISPSCVTVTQVNPGGLPSGVELAQGHRANCKPREACPACSLFGRMSRLGKVAFGDARLIGAGPTQLFRLAPLFAPRAVKAPPAYQDSAGNFKGRKFYHHSRPLEDERQPPVEVIPTGRLVQGQVDFENLTSAELGLLFFALGLDGSIALKLGGGKPLGLGSLRIAWAELALLGADHYLQAEAEESHYSGQALANLVGEMFEAALKAKFILREQVIALADILTYTPDRPAPSGAY